MLVIIGHQLPRLDTSLVLLCLAHIILVSVLRVYILRAIRFIVGMASPFAA